MKNKPILLGYKIYYQACDAYRTVYVQRVNYIYTEAQAYSVGTNKMALHSKKKYNSRCGKISKDFHPYVVQPIMRSLIRA